MTDVAQLVDCVKLVIERLLTSRLISKQKFIEIIWLRIKSKFDFGVKTPLSGSVSIVFWENIVGNDLGKFCGQNFRKNFVRL